MGIIIFNGKSSGDYGIQVEHPPDYETPQKDYDIRHIPGKNGDIFIDKGSFKNTARTYQIAIGSMKMDFAQISKNISHWLYSANSYARLEDSYEPEYYRLAIYDKSIELENILNHAGRATISFNCKPQRFLKIGDRVLKYTSVSKLFNPTMCKALPIITVKGSGSGVLRVGDYIVTISEIGTSITIDSEIQDAYNGVENRNNSVKLSSGFPKLVAGDNEISYSGGITSVEVIPKWWTL